MAPSKESGLPLKESENAIHGAGRDMIRYHEQLKCKIQKRNFEPGSSEPQTKSDDSVII